jgi:hypothetical protein
VTALRRHHLPSARGPRPGEVGRIRAVIDRAYPLPKTADAIRRVESGQAQGKVVITA